jgi:putative flavoprotein involved in K+ transport
VLDERWTDVADLGRARRLPSLQLVGSPEARDLDLNTLSRNGVEITGRITEVRGRSALCSGGLRHLCQSADLKQRRLLDRIDTFATEHGLDAELTEATRPEPTRIADPPTEIDLDAIGTVVWATASGSTIAGSMSGQVHRPRHWRTMVGSGEFLARTCSAFRSSGGEARRS